MSALVKKQQASETDSTTLLSIEILNSLLMKFKMLMDKNVVQRKPLLRNFLLEKSLNFLQEFCAPAIQELMQLVIFYDLPMNFHSEQLNLENVNFIQFLAEIKERQGLETTSAEFILNLWRLLRN